MSSSSSSSSSSSLSALIKLDEALAALPAGTGVAQIAGRAILVAVLTERATGGYNPTNLGIGETNNLAAYVNALS